MATLTYSNFNSNFTTSTSWKITTNLNTSVQGNKVAISGSLTLASTGAYIGYSLQLGLSASTSGGDYGTVKSGGGVAPSLSYKYFDYYTEDTHEQYYTAQIVQPSGVMFAPSNWKLTVPSTYNDGTHGSHRVSNAGSKLAVSTSKYVSSVSKTINLLVDIPSTSTIDVYVLVAQNGATPKYAKIQVESPVIITKPTLSSTSITCGDSVVVGLENMQPGTTHTLSLVGQTSGEIYYAVEDITTAQTITTLQSWANNIPTLSEIVVVSLTTFNELGEPLGVATVDLTLNVPSYSLEHTFSTSFSNALSNYAVQGKTSLIFEIRASSKFGATIESYSVSVSDETVQGATGSILLTKSGSLTATSTVVDSRGVVSTSSKAITVYPYSVPSINSAEPTRSGQAVSVKVGSSISPINGANTRSITIKYGDTVVGTKSGASDSQVISLSGTYATTENYTLTATVSDAFSTSAVYTFQVETEEPWLAASPDHKGTSIGMIPTGDRKFQVGWDTEIGTSDNPVSVLVNGQPIGGGVVEETYDITSKMSRSSGNCTLSNCLYKRYGNVITIYFRISGSSSTASAGNFWLGTINDSRLVFPPFNATGASYYSATPVIFGLTSTGTLTIRNASASSRNLTDASSCSITYVI